jgi:hypothetical protein
VNAKLEPLLVALEQGAAELAKRTAKLHERVLAHEAADAEAEQRMAELKLRARSRDRSRFRSEGRR